MSIATVDTVRELLAETMVSRTSLTVGVPGNDTCVILASEARDAVSIRGITVQVGRFPSRFSAEAGPKQLTLASDDLDDLQQVLGFAPLSGVVTLIPLRAAGLPMGVLMVESPARLPAEHTSAMASVAASAALALTDIRLTEDLRRDIAERRVLEGELAQRAFHDPLTELPNRALLVERLQQALARTRRSA